MSVGYADTQPITQVPRVPRLGLRARWRAAREARMTSVLARGRLAEQIEHAIARADKAYAPFTAAIPVCRPAVREGSAALLDLAERLRAPRRVDPAGVRLARTLLTDGAGPLYVQGEPGELKAAAIRALEALDHHGPRR